MPDLSIALIQNRQIWEDIDALGNTYIWQLLLSF